MATFDSLPSELVAEIIEYVDVEDFDDDGPGRIKDMQNVRLVTRQLREIATPILFRTYVWNFTLGNRENEIRMVEFAKAHGDLAKHAQSWQFRFPFLVDRRNMADQVDQLIDLHHLRRTAKLENGIVTLLRKHASSGIVCPASALDRKYPFVGRKVNKKFLHAHFPNLGRVETSFAGITHLFLSRSEQVIDGQTFTFDGGFHDFHYERLSFFILEHAWVNKLLAACCENVTSFTLNGLRFSDDFAHNLALIPQVKEVDLEFLGPANMEDNEAPRFSPRDTQAWRDRLGALPYLVRLRLAFALFCDWNGTVKEWAFGEFDFPYLEDVFPKSSKLRYFESANWPIRLASLCNMIEALGSDQELAFEDLPINYEATELDFADAHRAFMLPVVMGPKQVTISNAYLFYISHCQGHCKGCGCELKQTEIDEDRMAELWAEARGLADARKRVMGF